MQGTWKLLIAPILPVIYLLGGRPGGRIPETEYWASVEPTPSYLNRSESYRAVINPVKAKNSSAGGLLTSFDWKDYAEAYGETPREAITKASLLQGLTLEGTSKWKNKRSVSETEKLLELPTLFQGGKAKFDAFEKKYKLEGAKYRLKPIPRPEKLGERYLLVRETSVQTVMPESDEPYSDQGEVNYDISIEGWSIERPEWPSDWEVIPVYEEDASEEGGWLVVRQYDAGDTFSRSFNLQDYEGVFASQEKAFEYAQLVAAHETVDYFGGRSRYRIEYIAKAEPMSRSISPPE